MAIEYVNGSGVHATGSSTTTVIPALNAVAGNTIIVFAGNYKSGSYESISGVTDTAGNTYARCGNVGTVGGDYRNECWAAYDIDGNASNEITVTYANATTFREAIAIQYSGLAAESAYDAESGQVTDSPPTTIHTTGTLETTQADEVIVGFFVSWDSLQNMEVESPYNKRYEIGDYSATVLDRIVSTTGTYSVTGGTGYSCQKTDFAKSFKMATASGHPTMKRWGGVPFVGLNRGVW